MADESTQVAKPPKAPKATSKALKSDAPTTTQPAAVASSNEASAAPANGANGPRPARKGRQGGPRSQAFLTYTATLNSFHAQTVFSRSFTVGDEALYTLSVILRVLAPESECTKVDELVNQQLSATQKVISDEAARLEKLAESFGVSGTGMSYSAPLSVSAKLTSPRAASWINLIRDYDQLVEKFDILWLSHVISDSEHSKGIFNIKRVLMRCANDLRSLAIRSMAAAQRNGEHNVPDPRAGTALSKEAAPVVNGEAQEAAPELTQPAVLDAVEVPATEAAPEEAIA